MSPLPSPEFLRLHDALMEVLAGNRQSDPVSILRQMAALRQPGGLPLLLEIIHHPAEPVRAAAEDAVETLMANLLPVMLPGMEGLIRQSWLRYSTSDPTPRARRAESHLLSTLDPNGRQREFALRRL